MSNSHPPESRDTDTTVEGLYSVFHDGPCGKHYRQWEQCVELCRKANDIQNLDTRYVVCLVVCFHSHRCDPFTRPYASRSPGVECPA
jgi:hypothetical protein